MKRGNNMCDLSELSSNDIKYICEHMHFPSVKLYLQKNPKIFNKIKPGFTVKKMSDNDILAFLTKNFHNLFVQSLVQITVADWISQIQKNIELLEEQGFSSGESLLKTIPDSFFNERAELYFKLTEQEYNDSYIQLINDSLSLMKKVEAASVEKFNADEINRLQSELKDEIAELNQHLSESKQCEESLQKKLDEANRQIEKYQKQLSQANEDINSKNEELNEVQHKLDYYHRLERYIENDVSYSELKKFQYTSIGQIIYDYYNDQRLILRLADIDENGLITPFIADENIPHYFANRDRLYWKNGPASTNTIGVWNWNAIPRDTDPEKDYLETNYCSEIKITQIVILSNCKSLNDVTSLLKKGLSLQLVCNKFLFAYEDNSILRGLLCSSDDFDKMQDSITLKSSIYFLPQYCVKRSDLVYISGISIYKYINWGIPQSDFQIREPYETVKSLILARMTNSVLREYELSTREIQHCRQFLKSLPTQELAQELAHIYNCTKEVALGYIDGFIDHAEAYLISSDLDSNIISRALQNNPDLVMLCKQQLTNEWKAENEKQHTEIEEKLNDITSAVKAKQSELQQINAEKNKLYSEIEQLHFQLSQRENLASEVEKKIALKIEQAKQNAAEFISRMAFVSPAINLTAKQLPNTLSVFNSKIDCVESGVIDDIDSFEEELSENLTLIGYDNEQTIEISQAASFGISENIPLIINENAKAIAQCLAATLNCNVLSEIFVSMNGVYIEDILNIIDNISKIKPTVYLIHGVFDSYSINLFNAISSLMNQWNNVIIILSLEGVPENVIPSSVWNRAIYVDGDSGYSGYNRRSTKALHTFKISEFLKLNNTGIDVNPEHYKDAKKSIKPFSSILSNTQTSLYAKYLSAYRISLNDSKLILTQLIVTANAIGNVEYLKELFHENGISNGEKLLEK